MKKQVSVLAFVLLCFQLSSAQSVNSSYTEKVRNNASTFHKNFTTGDFDKNGALVNEKIYVNSNNAIVIGKDKFVQRIKRFHTPFPDLALRDRIVLVDENQVALLYIMQGTQTGPYGSIPQSGNKINVYAAEFFTMDDNALMKELLTITQLDQLVRQIKGEDKIQKQEDVTLMPTKKTNEKYKRMLKDKLDAYVQNFNTRDWAALDGMFTNNATIKINGTTYKGTSSLTNALKSIIEKIPDATYHLIRNVVEGDRGAIAYEVNGTPTNSGKNEKEMKQLQDVKQGIHFQFDEAGKIADMVVVYNSEDLRKQLM